MFNCGKIGWTSREKANVKVVALKQVHEFRKRGTQRPTFVYPLADIDPSDASDLSGNWNCMINLIYIDNVQFQIEMDTQACLYS